MNSDSTPSDVAVEDVEVPAVEMQISGDLARRGLIASPLIVGAATIVWGLDGLASGAFALGLVLANFVLAALMVSSAARISPPAVMVAALGGFVIRLGIIMIAVLLVRDQQWISLQALGAVIIVAHLGLLLWELNHVSISFAHSGIRSTHP